MPNGELLAEGDVFRFPELGDALERFGEEGAAPFYAGEIGEAISNWVLERGGTLAREDLAAYETVEREPVRGGLRGSRDPHQPAALPGGILIAFCLAVLERAGGDRPRGHRAAMEEAQAARTEAFNRALHEPGFAARALDASALDAAARRVAAGERVPRPGGEPVDRVGSTTHITAVDAEGNAASVTCSNGSGSGLIVVPAPVSTLNNMLGEQDLNPLGFHVLTTGARLPSMMSPVTGPRGRRARDGPRQRRLQPDPLGDPADDRPAHDRRALSRRCGLRAAGAFRERGGPG